MAPVSRSLGAMDHGTKSTTSSVRISPKSDRDLIYDDCPGGRALAAQAAAQAAAAAAAANQQLHQQQQSSQQQQQYGFHSLPHYHQSAYLQKQNPTGYGNPNATGNPVDPHSSYSYQSASSTPRRAQQVSNQFSEHHQQKSISFRSVRSPPPQMPAGGMLSNDEHSSLYATPPPFDHQTGPPLNQLSRGGFVTDGGPSFRHSDVYDVSLEGSGTTLAGTTASLSSKTESNTVVENHAAAAAHSHSRTSSWKSLNKSTGRYAH